MQILPDYAKRADQAMNALEGASSSHLANRYSTASQPFGDLMNSLAAADTRSRDEAMRLSSSLQSMADHYAESSPTSSTGKELESNPAGLQVTQEDFADLRDELEQYGLSTDDIATLEEQVSSPEGITWRELMNKVTTLAAQGSGESQSLDVETKRLLTGFLDRLGFSQGEVKEIVTDLDEDKLDAAWQKIAAKLAGISPDKTFTVSRDEIKALAKAFNVPGTDDKTLASFFAGGGKLSLNAAGLQNLLLMLKQASIGQSQQDQENAGESLKSIHEKLQNAISRAMERAERDELASNHETKTASQSKLLIKKAAEEHHGEAANRVSRPDGDEAKNAESKHLFKEPVHQEDGDDQQDSGKNVIGKAESGKAESGKDAQGEKNTAGQEGAKGNAGSQVQEAKVAGAAAGDELAATKDASDAATNRFAKERAEAAQTAQAKSQNANSGNSDAKSSGGDSNARSDESWSAFWNKVAKGEVSPEKSNEFVSVVDRSQAEARATATAERTTQAFRRDGSLARETMRNLEQAFMKNLGEGQRQLTLRLDPPQMGRVAVLLTVKNNEVSATLRTEKHETGQMLAEQLQQLRHSLEQQGLRVQKLDVQTQLNNDANHQSWLGMDNHNMAREHSARQQTLKAWKQMHGNGESEASLAHDVQNGTVQEQISQGGLHLIA